MVNAKVFFGTDSRHGVVSHVKGSVTLIEYGYTSGKVAVTAR